MAVTTVTVASFGGGMAWVTFDYDDVDMEVIAVAAVNDHPTHRLVLDVTYPKILTREVPSGQTLNLPLPPGQHIAFTSGTDYHGNARWVGIEWSATLGV